MSLLSAVSLKVCNVHHESPKGRQSVHHYSYNYRLFYSEFGSSRENEMYGELFQKNNYYSMQNYINCLNNATLLVSNCLSDV